MNDSVAAARADAPHRTRGGVAWTALGGVALVFASIALFLVSRGKWSDAIIDSGREWIVPDALARGDLLYRDVVYWFGPLTPYFHAAFFALFGSSFRTLVVAGVVGSLGVLAALHFALRTITGRREAALWTALAIPALVFMPNAGGSILGMGYRIWHAAAFCLLAIALAGRPPSGEPSRRSLAVGALVAFAGLCRTEWGLAGLAASVLASGVRQGFRDGFAREVALTTAAALLVYGGVLSLFMIFSGPAALLSDAPVLLVGIPALTRHNIASGGLRDWRSGMSSLLYSTAMWVGAFLFVELISVRRQDPGRARRRAPWVLAVAAILAMTAANGGRSGAVLFSAAPVACAAGVVVGLATRTRPNAATLTGLGLAGVLLSHRRLFHIADAAYVAPPLLFAFCSAAVLIHRAIVCERVHLRRGRLRHGILVALTVLVVCAFGGRAFQYASDDRVPVPGTSGMISARSDLSSEIAELVSAVRRHTREGDGLVVFPEGELLNYLSGRRNPLRYKLYLPGYVTDSNEEEILRELDRARPAAVVIWNRPTGEYGPGLFGEDYARAIRRWIEDNYTAQPYDSPGRPQAVLMILRSTH